MSEEAEAGWSLVVSFPDQSEAFVYGFAAGQLWERMKSGSLAEIVETTRVENREVIQRMAIADGWRLTATPTEVEGWDETKLEKVASAPDRPNPTGLRIVR